MNIYFIIFFTVLGAAVGSFLNVCIYRIPAGASIILPPSHCPVCKHAIRFYDNIPILSYIILRGRCRFCAAKISVRYPIVELLTALTSLIFFLKYGLSWAYLCNFLFTAALIVVTFIDLDHRIIPDVITLPGIPLFAAAAIFLLKLPYRESLLGIVIGGGVFYLVGLGYELIKKREGMGGGDIKLFAMIGGFLGWKSLIFVLLVSSFLGAVIGISVIIYKKGDMKYAIPFGPFLSIAAVSYLFWGDVFMKILIHGCR